MNNFLLLTETDFFSHANNCFQVSTEGHSNAGIMQAKSNFCPLLKTPGKLLLLEEGSGQIYRRKLHYVILNATLQQQLWHKKFTSHMLLADYAGAACSLVLFFTLS